MSSSISTYADDDALGGHGQSPERMSLDQPPSTLESQVLLRCIDFPPCNKSFTDQRSFTAHVRYVLSRSSTVQVVLTALRNHKGWGTRRATRGGSPAVVRKVKTVADASASRTTAEMADTPPSVDRPNSSPLQGVEQEVVMAGGLVEPELTTASLQVPSDFPCDVSGHSPMTATTNIPNRRPSDRLSHKQEIMPARNQPVKMKYGLITRA